MITGDHSNFDAQAWAAAQIRAGKLEDRDYSIEEVETLYMNRYRVNSFPSMEGLFNKASQFQRSRKPPRESRILTRRFRELVHRSKRP